ncbi:MAG: hypothetical protein M3R70_07895 [Actinomycetota bacterium]|nr:hypothetical protein [Actinomycetota bacterium]
MSKMPPHTGPFVAVATFCERVLQEGDNTVSVIRVVDRLTITAQGAEPPPELPPYPMGLMALVILRRGSARGRQMVKIRPEDPGAERRPDIEIEVQLTGDEEQGANIIADFTGFALDREGLWWFDVLFGDSETLLARIPLRVVYQRVRVNQPG